MPDKTFTKISFYIVAHADDWQLFMQPNAYNDLITPDCKVVYIITTAGDAGLNDTYWRAREQGMKSSVRFCIASFANLTEKSGSRQFNNHKIKRWSANNAICYFLRLPDGNLNGKGFAKYNFQSLFNLSTSNIETINAVDNSSTYHGWPDFYNTLEKIVLFESKEMSNIWINYLNPDARANPKDHADHMATGQAIQAMTTNLNSSQLLFAGYSVNGNLERLDGADLFWKAGMFAAYEKAVFDYCGYSTLRENVDLYLQWSVSKALFFSSSKSS